MLEQENIPIIQPLEFPTPPAPPPTRPPVRPPTPPHACPPARYKKYFPVPLQPRALSTEFSFLTHLFVYLATITDYFQQLNAKQ